MVNTSPCGPVRVWQPRLDGAPGVQPGGGALTLSLSANIAIANMPSLEGRETAANAM
jgi:hypothetical protein